MLFAMTSNEFWIIAGITLFAMAYSMHRAAQAAKSAASAVSKSPVAAGAAKGIASYLLGRMFR